MGGKLDALNKLAEGSYGTEGETIDWSYWDSAIMAAPALNWRMFTAPLGGAAGRVLADTNMTTSGMIPQAQYFEVFALKVFYCSSANRAIGGKIALFNLLNRSTLSIRLTNKSNTGEWGFDELMGISMMADIGAVTDALSFPEPRYHAIYPLKNKIILAAMTPFEVNMIHHVAAVPALCVGDIIKVSLAGILTRAT